MRLSAEKFKLSDSRSAQASGDSVQENSSQHFTSHFLLYMRLGGSLSVLIPSLWHVVESD
jgi:hypothetical protein